MWNEKQSFASFTPTDEMVGLGSPPLLTGYGKFVNTTLTLILGLALDWCWLIRESWDYPRRRA